jgi:hypothetical protein
MNLNEKGAELEFNFESAETNGKQISQQQGNVFLYKCDISYVVQ